MPRKSASRKPFKPASGAFPVSRQPILVHIVRNAPACQSFFSAPRCRRTGIRLNHIRLAAESAYNGRTYLEMRLALSLERKLELVGRPGSQIILGGLTSASA